MKQETHQASPEMKKFFEGLLKLKKFAHESYLESDDEDMKKIYEGLDALIKEGK